MIPEEKMIKMIKGEDLLEHLGSSYKLPKEQEKKDRQMEEELEELRNSEWFK